jgi:hypothetical protein
MYEHGGQSEIRHILGIASLARKQGILRAGPESIDALIDCRWGF